MSKVIATSTERMGNDITAYNDHLVKMQNSFNEAWNAVEALNATWAGPAHDTLVAQFREDQEVMKNLMTNLTAYREELRSAKREYENCEKNVNALIRSMNV